MGLVPLDVHAVELESVPLGVPTVELECVLLVDCAFGDSVVQQVVEKIVPDVMPAISSEDPVGAEIACHWKTQLWRKQISLIQLSKLRYQMLLSPMFLA